ncbi:glycosyltransferase [Candidatus Woesearchaeota archaeon]|nr:glycosyltransferase [Candidatus Woesearchaeota archaeon]
MEYVYRSGKSFYSGSQPRFSASVKDVSVIIPTYNEEGVIGRLVEALSSALKGYDFEIVIVDDNSRDKTPEIADRLASSGKVAVLHRRGVKGIFSALQDGIKVAKGRVVVIMDADFSHPPGTVPRLVEGVKDHDIVIGSRFVKGADFSAPFERKYGPMILNAVCRLVLGLKSSDIFTGFHAMKREKFMQLKFRYPSVWGEFDMELLFRAQKAGFRMKDMPFSYNFRSEGKSKSSGFKVVRYGFAYLVRAFQLRFFG